MDSKRVIVSDRLDGILEELTSIEAMLSRDLESGRHVDRSSELAKSIKVDIAAAKVNYLLRACQEV